jgi:hypothetical protein
MDQPILDSFWHGGVCLPIERRVIVVEHSRNSVKVDQELHRLVVVFHHQLFELDFGFGLLVVRAKVDVQLSSEKLEVREPFRFVCWIVDYEGLEVIESRSLQEGQNIVDLGSVVAKVFRLGSKVQFALQEEAVGNATCLVHSRT